MSSFNWPGSSGSSGITSVGIIDSQTASANGAVVSANSLVLQSATPLVPGLVNLTTQSFAGNKTFTGSISASNLSGTNTGDVTLGTANGLSLSGQALSLGLSSTSTTGALSSTDWNTFNGKQASLTLGNVTDGADGILSFSGGTGAVVGSGLTITVQKATASVPGYLAAADFTTFNAKVGSVASSNGFAGSVSSGVATLSTSITGILKGNGTAISAGTSGTDYSAGTSGLSTGILKSTTTTGALTIAVAGDFPTLNQNTSGSAGSISASNVITNSNLSQMATNTIKGNNTGGTANAADLTVAQVTTLLSATTPTASTISQWDANKNLQANNHIEAFQTIATAAGTTTLTVASPYTTQFTGSTTQTVTLPVASTLTLGQSFMICNRSSGVVTVNSSGANLVQSMAAGSQTVLTCVLVSGTTAASWDSAYSITSASAGGFAGVVLIATGTPANPGANNPIVFPTTQIDTASGYNNSTGRYTTNFTGYMAVSCTLEGAMNTGSFVNVYKNATISNAIGNVNSFDNLSGGVTVVAVTSGDILDVRQNASSAMSAGGNMCMWRVG